MSQSEQHAEATDLEILFSDREIQVMGQTVTVRELRFSEQLHHHQLLAPLAAALVSTDQALMTGPESVNRLYDLMAEHWEDVLSLMAICCDRDQAWVRSLPPADGENLMLAWWGVNSSFFIRRAWRPRLAEAVIKQAGDSSSPPSSAPDTTGADSAATPPAS